MRVVNRLLSILVALAVIVATICILLVMLIGVAPASLSPTPWFDTQLSQFTALNGGAWDRAVAISAAMLFLGLILLFMDMMPERAYTGRRARRVGTDRVITERPVESARVTPRTEPADTVVAQPDYPVVNQETASHPVEDRGD